MFFKTIFIRVVVALILVKDLIIYDIQQSLHKSKAMMLSYIK